MPGSGPTVKTTHFHCQGMGSIPGQGNRKSCMPCSLTKKNKFRRKIQKAAVEKIVLKKLNNCIEKLVFSINYFNMSCKFVNSIEIHNLHDAKRK